MTWVLDTSALICWIDDEPGAARMQEILTGLEPVVIHAVNVVEFQYLLLRKGGVASWELAAARFKAAGVETVRLMDDELLGTAARLKAFNAPIALGDVFAVALTVHRSATLLTTDHGELEKVAAAGVCSIEFLR